MRKINNKLIASTILIAWIALLIYAVADNAGLFTNTIGPEEALANSAFARTMFMDIGGLSTLAAVWIIFGSDKAGISQYVRYFFAFISLFVGSFAVMPFVSLYFWQLPKRDSSEERRKV
jgi:hypothetical protein